MRRSVIDNLEIIEPPLEELNKKRSGFLKACFTSCLFIIILIIGAIVFFRLFAGPGPKTLTRLPDNFPKDILVYDPDNIENITYISGKYKNRSIEIAALFPKVILSPLLLSLEKNQEPSADLKQDSGATLKNLWKIITAPVGDHRDTIQVEWRNLDTDAGFVVDHYKNELKKRNFTIDIESSGQGIEQFSFSRAADGLSGSLYVETHNQGTGTDYAFLTVNLPPPNPTK